MLTPTWLRSAKDTARSFPATSAGSHARSPSISRQISIILLTAFWEAHHLCLSVILLDATTRRFSDLSNISGLKKTLSPARQTSSLRCHDDCNEMTQRDVAITQRICQAECRSIAQVPNWRRYEAIDGVFWETNKFMKNVWLDCQITWLPDFSMNYLVDLIQWLDKVGHIH